MEKLPLVEQDTNIHYCGGDVVLQHGNVCFTIDFQQKIITETQNKGEQLKKMESQRFVKILGFIENRSGLILIYVSKSKGLGNFLNLGQVYMVKEIKYLVLRGALGYFDELVLDILRNEKLYFSSEVDLTSSV